VPLKRLQCLILHPNDSKLNALNNPRSFIIWLYKILKGVIDTIRAMVGGSEGGKG